MKTLYIDIYFLVNLTVDIISLYFAAIFSRICVSNRRLFISALVGALISSALVFVNSLVIKIALTIAGFILVMILASAKNSVKRKFTFAISFLIFIGLISSIVSYLWNLFSDVFSGYILSNDTVNRKMLFFSVIVLLSIGVVKMFITVMHTTNTDSVVNIEIGFLSNVCKTEALVDTGNLALDPMSMRPVLFVKKEMARDFLPSNMLELRDIDSLSRDTKKRIRLIPISRGEITHVLIGIVPDFVKVSTKSGCENIDVIIAIDKEGGDYGGYTALMPSSAVKNVHN